MNYGNHVTVTSDAMIYISHDRVCARPQTREMDRHLAKAGASILHKTLFPLSSNDLLADYQMARPDQWVRQSVLWKEDTGKPILLEGWGRAQNVIVCPCDNPYRRRVDIGCMRRYLRIIYGWAVALGWKKVHLAANENQRDLLDDSEGRSILDEWGPLVDFQLVVHKDRA